jgi:hypothetical protein
MDRLSFVQTFVFQPNHMEQLPVREANKEQRSGRRLRRTDEERSRLGSGWGG